MADADFESLCAALCEAVGAGAPVLADNSLTSRSLSLQWDGVPVSLTYFPLDDPDTVFALVDLGPPMPEQELAEWRALLEANFLVRRDGAMSFGRDTDSGAVVLQCLYPLAGVTGPGLAASLGRMAGVAHRWRRGAGERDGEANPYPVEHTV